MEYKSETTGAQVIINPCSLTDAFRLKSVIQKALLGQNLNIEQLLDVDIMTILMSLDSSEEVFESMFVCLRKSLYNGNAIKPEVFDDVKAREDLYEIFLNCIKVNIYPFFKTAFSKLGIQQYLETLKGNLKQTLGTKSNSSAAVSQNTGISAETLKE